MRLNGVETYHRTPPLEVDELSGDEVLLESVEADDVVRLWWEEVEVSQADV